MVRSLSQAMLEGIFSQETKEVALIMLTIEHEDLSAPIRAVLNTENIVSRGETFLAAVFDVTFPTESADEVPRAKLRIDNVDRVIVQAVRSISGPPTVTLEVALASSPDTIEIGPYEFELTNVEYDELWVQGDIAYEDILNAAYPADTMTPADFPGIF